MNNILTVQNNQVFESGEINFVSPAQFQENVLSILAGGARMAALTPADKKDPVKLVAVFINEANSSLIITGGTFEKNKLEFESFAGEYPHTNYFECELSEMFGYTPVNHPWLRPVRKQKVIRGNQPYHFFKMEGEEIHEVAVGPIHAGVIEPGHFRFQCHGEKVYHLEINLGYQHRGVENLMLRSEGIKKLMLAESIAGDTVIGHTAAHCSAVENLSGIQVSLRAQFIRAIAEEMERIAMHLSGLSGAANDIGFALAASSYGRVRTLVINSLATLCGSRFGRGLFVYGGVRYDLKDETIRKIRSNLDIVKNDTSAINEYLFSSTGAITRFEGTGTVTKEFAEQAGLVGMAARSCGIEKDIRTQLPYGAYRYAPVSLISLATGDVYARVRLRALEIDESLKFIFEHLENLPEGGITEPLQPVMNNSCTVSVTEGWRGEIVHLAVTGSDGNFIQYKIKDPSFNNWYGLALALRKTAISDFPLCNKSFDLSYSGHDL